MAYENLTKPHIQVALSIRLDQAGISEPRLLKVLDEGLDAMLVKTATHEGKITDSREFPNYATRHRYLETALKLHNIFPAEKKNLKHDFNNDSEEKKRAAIERINRLISQKCEEEVQRRVKEEL